MNLKTFAQKSRNILMEGVARKVLYWGFDAKGNVVEEPTPVGGGYLFRGNIYDDPTDLKLWQALRSAIKRKGVKEVVEEAAYTWFNRIMAIRILSANKYEPPQLEYASIEVPMPQILQRARRGQYEYLCDSEKKRLQTIITDYSQDNQSFAILLVGYCHAHPLLKSVFGGINDYTELLLPDNILATNGFVHLLNTTDAITEEEYQKVESIGWLYQFYISDRRDEVFAGFKQNKKAEAKDIPAATQIFTPNWIVKYMVENTVGKLWLDMHPDSPIKHRMKYLVEGTNPEYGNPIISEIDQLKFLDPAVGSGHILVEGFDLLYEMYIEDFASPEEAVESILKNNLFGLDIDKRAVQLARFAVLLKAAKRHSDILKKGVLPHIYAMPEPYTFSRQEVLDFLGDEGRIYEEPLSKALKLLEDAQNLGSIMKFDLPEDAREFILKRMKELEKKQFKSFVEEVVLPNIRPYIKVLELLTLKYEAVAANPPYMGTGNMNNMLKEYSTIAYPHCKQDLYSTFIDKVISITINKGLIGLITPPSWLFTITFSELRKLILENLTINSLLNLGRGVFGVDFGSVSFILSKSNSLSRIGVYRSLFREKVTVDTPEQKRLWFLEKNYKVYYTNQSDFCKISDNPIAYWLPKKVFKLFQEEQKIGNILKIKVGLQTGDNDKFRRNWSEVSFKKISLECYQQQKKWFPYNSGGQYRKWYGNHDYVVNWESEGNEIKNFKNEYGKLKSRPQNINYYFNESGSWSKMTASGLAVRYYPKGFIFDVSGCSFFGSYENMIYTIGLLNSKLKEIFIDSINQSFNYEVGQISIVPFIKNEISSEICELIKTIIAISKNDWNSREDSWDFKYSPLLNNAKSLYNSYEAWFDLNSQFFFQMQDMEEVLNRMFLKAYGLQEELHPDVELTKVTILQDEMDFDALKKLEHQFREKGKDAIILPIKRDVVMEQFISYAIGVCMGRYRLDKPGLNIAHPNPTIEELSPYAYNGYSLQIDEDGIIPLMGRACQFTDDAFQRILYILQAIWGADTLTQNLNFMQECLNQDLEKYLVKNFWKDHVQMYKKKPIYWLFASPKGGFQVLVYMHRMNKFTVEKIRSNYLIEHLKHLRFQISQLENRVAILNRDEARLLDKLRVDLLECEAYDMLLKNIADQQIDLDLDNGVTANYELFKGVVAPIK
jgi:hypothetical protein